MRQPISALIVGVFAAALLYKLYALFNCCVDIYHTSSRPAVIRAFILLYGVICETAVVTFLCSKSRRKLGYIFATGLLFLYSILLIFSLSLKVVPASFSLLILLNAALMALSWKNIKVERKKFYRRYGLDFRR